ncbi:phosphatidate cytidylyltransferase [Campylobacter sp. MIT 12-8780]|uniref:phosphatidate cytidylyltransferase n=1 Tax=unclassified Campylobacter TaxID=2593542 RepID=UPI00115E36D2|nr:MULTISPECIES: phosphatidate cytidylyltransferase [unclassified Campylobacter]NDJ26751.1 phosphatidate cytidylyltransferase [Campylobacter sp. MIT 19-121]TQR42422.1 phosphatidate cytidylyltransferase [Campylobacter sp. MIT 12-8780]
MFDTTRIISGVVLAAGVILILLINELALNFVVFALLFYLAFNEGKALFKDQSANVWLGLLVFVIGSVLKEPLLVGALFFILVVGFLVYKKEKNLQQSLIYLYPTLPILALWQLYLEHGVFALFWLIFIVAVCDSSAYFVGKMIGSTPFSPTSPNKTREGVIGGLVFATIFGTLIGLFGYSFLLSLAVSFLSAVFAVIGDLLESYFKRKAKIKDSGNLIPGHGGILDRIDALIIAAFVMVALL